MYDQYRGQRRILVTGSARLDLYRYGGDSLRGRYFHLRLHPLSAAEVGAQRRRSHRVAGTVGLPGTLLRR
ncbi:MAG: AAA family ATPase [Betaproteobacteria bacterium]